ncbi:DEAD/DEAH box helicase, partial [Burkholderiales bacterium]|nr:DEAD/DEAH box helicase [Burkholderiales bacterium]
FEFVPKNINSGPSEGFDYEGGYDPSRTNVGVNNDTGQIQVEIKGLSEQTDESARIVKEDLNEIIATFVQDTDSVGRGMFDNETVPEELTRVKMGKVLSEMYPNESKETQEAVRDHAIAAFNLTQKAKELSRLNVDDDNEHGRNTALIDGVRKFVTDVRDLDIDMIDRINPYGDAYAVLGKSMHEESLRAFQAVITSKRANIDPDEAFVIAKRAVEFLEERGRDPSLTSADPFEQHLARGAEAYVRFVDEGKYEQD